MVCGSMEAKQGGKCDSVSSVSIYRLDCVSLVLVLLLPPLTPVLVLCDFHDRGLSGNVPIPPAFGRNQISMHMAIRRPPAAGGGIAAGIEKTGNVDVDVRNGGRGRGGSWNITRWHSGWQRQSRRSRRFVKLRSIRKCQNGTSCRHGHVSAPWPWGRGTGCIITQVGGPSWVVHVF